MSQNVLIGGAYKELDMHPELLAENMSNATFLKRRTAIGKKAYKPSQK